MGSSQVAAPQPKNALNSGRFRRLAAGMAENGVSGFFVILKISKANNLLSYLFSAALYCPLWGANEAGMHRMNFELESKTTRNAGSGPSSISPMIAVVFITWVMGLVVFRTWF
jgi:hypothetical protein